MTVYNFSKKISWTPSSPDPRFPVFNPSEETAYLAFPHSLVKSVPKFSSDLLAAMMGKTVSD
jgi:hypothetical protein